MSVTNFPDTGDIVYLDFDPQAGHEQRSRRPALVLTPHSYNDKVGLAIVVPITSKVKGYPFEVGLPDGLSVKGVILADQLKSCDWRARNAKLACKVQNTVVQETLEFIGDLLDM